MSCKTVYFPISALRSLSFCLAIALSIAGCGPNNRQKEIEKEHTKTGNPAPEELRCPGGKGCEPASKTVAPSVVTGILGNWCGTAYKRSIQGTWQCQPYKMALNKVVAPGGTSYLKMELAAQAGSTQTCPNPSLGNFGISAYLGLNKNAGYGSNVYSFLSSITTSPLFFDYPFSVELDFGFTGGILTSPSQAQMFILSCGYSENSCVSYSTDTGFGADLRKCN